MKSFDYTNFFCYFSNKLIFKVYPAAALLYLALYSCGDIPVIFLNTSRNALVSE
jgi:hypothetical protein